MRRRAKVASPLARVVFWGLVLGNFGSIMMRAGMMCLAIGLGAPVFAQDTTATPQSAPTQPSLSRSGILTVDMNALYAQSLFGVRLEEQIAAASAAQTLENEQIQAQLQAEEQDLTTERANLSLEAFRAKADAFDAKVQSLRAAQLTKARQIQALSDQGETQFIALVNPVLAEIARDLGALIVLERKSVILSAESIDITLEALRRLNAIVVDMDAAVPAQTDAAPTTTPTTTPATTPAPGN